MYLPANAYISQTTDLRRTVLLWLVGTGGVFLIMLLVIAAPIAAATQHEQVAQVLYRSFATVCHQLPERSYFIAGHKLAICSRCLGLYAGFGLTFLIYPLFRSLRTISTPPRKWLLLAALPLAVDFSLTFVEIWENTHTTRLLTGLLLGSVTVFYVIPGLSELSLRRRAAPKAGRSTFTLVSAEQIAAAPSDYSEPQRRI
jgi:uncharacterized membrane protein